MEEGSKEKGKEMSDGNEGIPSYIARENCGCIVGAVVDNPEHSKDVKETLHEWIDDGLIIERVTVGFVREHGLEKCEAHRESNQPELL